MKAVILLSGGLDSAANLALARSHGIEPILALTADYGQRAAIREIAAARALASVYRVRHEIVEIPFLGKLGSSALTRKDGDAPPPPDVRPEDLDRREVTEKSAAAVWVPNRNGVLIAIAAAYAEGLGAGRVLIGFNREEAATFADNSEEFGARSNRALALSTRTGVEVLSLVGEMDKSRIVEELKKLTEPCFPFDLVWSCYLGGAERCRRCESCRRFERAGGMV